MKILITGGAGFIGSNAAHRYLSTNHEVLVVDNLSRKGAASNLEWLKKHGVRFINLDIRDAEAVTALFRQHDDVDRILHLAAQVAVTTSVEDPRLDFEVNALGTVNVLEGIRAARIPAPIIYASTNKVYGNMEALAVCEQAGRYSYENLPFGVSETVPVSFHSPYGCSKGAADQYMADYHRIYGLKTIVFRQSCIYGYRQFGAEEQGWIAWFMIARRLGHPVTVFGDGKQVRDILFIEDLLDAYDAAFRASDAVAGRVFNIGGGPLNMLSIQEFLTYLDMRERHKFQYALADWRPGDQRIYVSDIRRAEQELGWRPKTTHTQGLDTLYEWICRNEKLFRNENTLAWAMQHA